MRAYQQLESTWNGQYFFKNYVAEEFLGNQISIIHLKDLTIVCLYVKPLQRTVLSGFKVPYSEI